MSTNFVFANFLASRSFKNVSVTLACFRFPRRGSSNETYHVRWLLLAMIRCSRGYVGDAEPPAVSPRATSGAFCLELVRRAWIKILHPIEHTNYQKIS